MAPSATMLFLSYHQLHGPATAAAAEAPRKVTEADGDGVRFSVSSVFSLGLGAFARRRDQVAAPPAEGLALVGCKPDAVEENTSAAAELEEKFEEALRLSCWSC